MGWYHFLTSSLSFSCISVFTTCCFFYFLYCLIFCVKIHKQFFVICSAIYDSSSIECHFFHSEKGTWKILYQKKIQPIVRGQRVLSGFLYKSCILRIVLEQIWTQWLTLTAIFFVQQQGSKTISWQTERTLHLHWSTLVSYLKTLQNMLERICKPHYDYQNFFPLANGTDLNRQKYAILQTHWH